MATRVRPKPPESQYQRGTPRPASLAGQPVSPKLRREVLDRDGYECQRCGRSVRLLLRYSLHHRRPRAAGGSKHANFAANLITLCGSATSGGGCHAWVETEARTVAMAQGFLVRQGHDPRSFAVLRFAVTDHPSWQVLTDDGWQPATAPAVVDTWSAASLEHYEATGEYLSAAVVAALAVGR